MRILFLSYAYPNAGQPQLAIFNRTMLAGLTKQHEVRVIAPVSFLQKWRRNPAPPDYAAHEQISAEYPTFYYTPKAFHEHYDDFLWWSVRDRVRKTIAEFRPDVILSYWAHPDGSVAVRAAREAGLPSVIMVGGSDVLVLARQGSRRTRILQTLNAADGVITVSQHLAHTLREDGLSSGKISIIPRGIDRSLFSPGNQREVRKKLGLPLDREIIVGVGRLVSVKDWPTWIETCAELEQRGRPLACYILGSGPLDDELHRLVRDWGLENVISFQGTQSQQSLADWYRAADLTLLTSLSEGIPNVLLESVACGCPFVATNVGGISEIADPIHDRLVAVGNPIALALAVADRIDHVPPQGLPRIHEPDSNESVTRQLTETLENVVRQYEKGASHKTKSATKALRTSPIPIPSTQD